MIMFERIKRLYSEGRLTKSNGSQRQRQQR